MVDQHWLPEGRHWGLNIIHHRAPDDAGTFTGPPHWKHVIHTTEGNGIDAMHRVLVNKRAEPHLLIDPSKGLSTVIQLLPFNVAARALEHPAGTPETNRAHVIQTEICDYAAMSPDWATWFYRDLAALFVLVEHRVDIPRRFPAAQGWHTANKVKRMGREEFATYRGYLGHQHVPDQPSGHWDPGAIDPNKLRAQMQLAEAAYR